ncbi:Uncharacterised protein r2_g1611 [Pycnogonum litorale]
MALSSVVTALLIRAVRGSLRHRRGQSQSHVDHVRRERHRPQLVLTTGPDDQSASLQRDHAAFASLGVREETRVATGQIVAASQRQCTCSQRPEHPSVPGRDEHHRTGTTSLDSPDLAPCDFFLFPKLKGAIKRTRFEGVEAVKRAVTTELRAIPEESFHQCIEAWHRRVH